MNPTPSISLEYFPATAVSSRRGLDTCAHALRRFDPIYQTVTFGADGGERETTVECALHLERLTEVPTATHLTLCAFDRAGFTQHLDRLSELGIRRLVLLRGDGRSEEGDGLASFSSVAEAVTFAKARHDFDVTVAAYPEPHPKAASAGADLDVLVGKFDAGADRAVTQFFFETETFLRFRDELARRRPEANLVAGVMPITSFTQTSSFAAKCGVVLPEALRSRFGSVDPSDHTALAREIVEQQVRELANEGETRLHVYTMNRVDLTADALRAFTDAVRYHSGAEAQTLAMLGRVRGRDRSAVRPFA